MAGIVKCGYCNHTLIAKSNTTSNGYEKYMVCTNCKNKATKLYILENKILEVLNKWLVNYRLSLKDEKDNSKPENTLEHTLINLNKELDTLEKQKERLHDF